MAKLSSMRFKDYVWPHNPRVYEIEYRRDVVSHRVPFGTYTLQNMGRGHRVLRGEGEFAGEGAYGEFKHLATVFYDTTPGVLVHPLWDAASAYFVALRLKQEPEENYVAYSFEFWECSDSYPAVIMPGASPAQETTVQEAAEPYYITVRDMSLFQVAKQYGLAITDLLAMNPQIRNPNETISLARIRIS